VYVIRGPVATPADVEVLASAGGERVVVSTASLRPGDQVVIEGNERLYPGAMVSAVGGDSDAAGSGGSDSRSPSGQGPEAAAPASADSADRG